MIPMQIKVLCEVQKISNIKRGSAEKVVIFPDEEGNYLSVL